VVDEVVASGEHHAVVDHHQVAEGLGLVDLDLLVRGLFFMQLLLDAKRQGHVFVRFAEPVVVECHWAAPLASAVDGMMRRYDSAPHAAGNWRRVMTAPGHTHA
jgi:hypothetical protein